jgi:hypothetical protein
MKAAHPCPSCFRPATPATAAVPLRWGAALAACFGLSILGCAVGPPPGGTGTGGAAGQSGSPCENGAAGGTAATAQAPEVPATPWLHVEGNQIKDPAGNVVILRGVATADIGSVEAWEGGITQMIDRLTNASDTQGCSPGWYTRVIRMTISPPDGDTTTPTQYRPGTNYYETLLRPAVDHATQKGLYVIIDWHYIADTSKHRETTTQFWTDIAPRFANDSNVLFELYNEPVNSGSWPLLRPDMQMWADLVRAAAPQNLILVGTPNWCQVVGPTATNPLTGDNLVYVAHMYPQHWVNTGLRAQITQAAAVHPVFVTEWGFEDSADAVLGGTVTSYGNPFKNFVEANKLSWIAWCASSAWKPMMFKKSDFSLLVGEGWLGGFAKDWLYEKRDADQPAP